MSDKMIKLEKQLFVKKDETMRVKVGDRIENMTVENKSKGDTVMIEVPLAFYEKNLKNDARYKVPGSKDQAKGKDQA
jgi:hypothetical protein